MTVRESPDELTLRAEEVGTLKTYISVNHTEKERWGPPQFDNDWYAFCQALYRGIEGEDWGELFRCLQRNGCEAKAVWKMKAAKEAGEEYYDPTLEDNIRERNDTRLALWEEHFKDPIVALDRALKVCVEISYERSRPECLAEVCLVMAGAGFLHSLW